MNDTKTVATEKKVFARSPVLGPYMTHYCPGCGHGIVHRLVAEAIEHYGIRERTVCVAPVGCSVLAYKYISRRYVGGGARPGAGRGHRHQAGTARPVRHDLSGRRRPGGHRHGRDRSCRQSRREHLLDFRQQRRLRHDGRTNGARRPCWAKRPRPSPAGRTRQSGRPADQGLRNARALDGPSYIARVTVDKPAAVRKAKQAIITAFGRQLTGKGFSLVEVLSPCPTYWRLPPPKASRAHRKLDGQDVPVGRI